jgi:hypothetical protein
MVRSAGLVALLAGVSPAWAEPPAALDRVPANAGMVVAVRNMEQFSAKVRSVMTTMHLGAESFRIAAVAQVLMGTPGVNKAGSMALVAIPGPNGVVEDDESRNLLALVPVSDYALLLQSLGGDPAAKVAKIVVEGKEAFVRDVGGGYAVVGPVEETVRAFESNPGNAAAHTRAMGATAPIADGADLLFLMHPKAMKPALDRQKEQFAKNRGMLGGLLGGAGEEPDPKAEPKPGAASAAIDGIERDGTLSVVGVRLGDAGLIVDLGQQFQEGSESASLFTGTGDSGRLMAKLPAQDFYMAAAMDMSVPGVRKLMDSMGGGAPDGKEAPRLLAGITDALRASDGFALAFGQSPGGVMGGTLFANTLAFVAGKDPAKMLQAARDRAKEMHEKKIGGVTFGVDYKQDQPLREMTDQKVDSWTTTMTFDPNDAQAGQMEMGLNMILGGNQVSNMAAAVDGGMIVTMSKNSRLMRSAVTASKGGPGMISDESLRSVQAMLPAKRSFEAYVSVKGVMEAVRDSMMMDEADMPLPARTAPLGLAGTTNGGAMTLRLVVPADAMPVIAEAAKFIRQGGRPGGGDGAAPAPKSTTKQQF